MEKNYPVLHISQTLCTGKKGRSVDINGYIQFAGNGSDAFDMIGMFMTYQNAFYFCRFYL